MTADDIARLRELLDKALREHELELLGSYDVHPEAYENDVEAPEHRRAFLDHLLTLAHPALEAAEAARVAAAAEAYAKGYSDAEREISATAIGQSAEAAHKQNAELRAEVARLRAKAGE